MLDEASWTLTVGGERVAIEAKPLALLHELLLRAGHVVSKDELLDAIWPGVSVVEASLPTAVSKLRRALGDGSGDTAMVETVPRIGYRLVASVSVEYDGETAVPAAGAPDGRPLVHNAAPSATAVRQGWSFRRRAIAGVAAVATLFGADMTTRMFSATPPATAKPFTHPEVMDALRRLDAVKLRDLIARGWSPAAPIDRAGDTPIDIALEICEWNKGHDREQLMLVVRMLMDNGDRIDRRNIFGDTAYSIAKAPRYCGPDHPATRLLYAQCYSGSTPPGDKCLATYELRRKRETEDSALGFSSGRGNSAANWGRERK